MIQDTNDCVFERGGKRFRFRAGAVIIEDGCVLLVTNDKAEYMYSVGGGVHIGETAEQAVMREVREETGVDYEIDRLAYIHQNFFNDKTVFDGDYHELAFYYLMKPRGTKALSCARIGDERTVWVPLEEVKNHFVLPRFFAELGDIPNYPKVIITDEIQR